MTIREHLARLYRVTFRPHRRRWLANVSAGPAWGVPDALDWIWAARNVENRRSNNLRFARWHIARERA